MLEEPADSGTMLSKMLKPPWIRPIYVQRQRNLILGVENHESLSLLRCRNH